MDFVTRERPMAAFPSRRRLVQSDWKGPVQKQTSLLLGGDVGVCTAYVIKRVPAAAATFVDRIYVREVMYRATVVSGCQHLWGFCCAATGRSSVRNSQRFQGCSPQKEEVNNLSDRVAHGLNASSSGKTRSCRLSLQ